MPQTKPQPSFCLFPPWSQCVVFLKREDMEHIVSLSPPPDPPFLNPLSPMCPHIWLCLWHAQCKLSHGVNGQLFIICRYFLKERLLNERLLRFLLEVMWPGFEPDQTRKQKQVTSVKKKNKSLCFAFLSIETNDYFMKC